MQNKNQGLTNVDIDIIDKIISDNRFPTTGLTQKQVLYIFHEYKKQRFAPPGNTRKSGYKEFSEFIKYCFNRNLANYDTLILITALKGTGKSSAAIQMARAWCKIASIKFDPRKHIAYDNADIMRGIKELPPFSPLICDEALRFISAEDWAKAENKELKKLLGQVRTKHLFFIMCFPMKVSKVEKTYLNSYVDYWIDLYARGLGAVFVKDMNPSSNDVWNLKKFEKIASWNEFAAPALIEKKIAAHPNFWTLMTVPKVPKEVYTRYLEVRESNVYSEGAAIDAMTKEDFYRAALIMTLKDIVSRDGTLTMQRLIKSIERIYKITMSKQQLDLVVKDAENLLKKSAALEDKQ